MNGTPHGRIPPNMLLCDPRKGHEKYIWYNPPQKKERCTSNPVCTLLTEHSMFPGLFMWWNRRAWTSMPSRERFPREQTELYLDTLLQCNRSGCLSGELVTGKTVGHRFFRLPEYWEKRFWLSEFSHLGGSRNPTRSNLVSVTEKARENPFDYSELKPSGKKLKDILL